MSRASFPKQLLPLMTNLSLMQETVKRVSGHAIFGQALIVASEDHRFIIAEQLRHIDIRAQAIMLEPMAKNTAPATAAAALWLASHDPGAIMLVMPSDHVITDPAAFIAAVEIGADAARSGRLVTFGIEASRPETGYGFLRHGKELYAQQVFELASFHEKPELERAQAFVASKEYSWNSGIFLFPAEKYLAEYERFQPESFMAVRGAVENATADLDFVRLDRGSFGQAVSDSVDYAVMERTDMAAVVPVKMGWSDVGAWDALWEVNDKSAEGNVVLGDVIAIDTRNSYLRSEERLLAAVGVEDLVIVSTPDAVLVAPKSRAQDVKKLIDRMKLESRLEVNHHATVHRPWGTYRSIHTGDRVQVKHITVKPGERLSLQMHHHRAEHWVVVSGTARITRDDEEFVLTENQSTYIPLGTRHRLENPGRIPLHLIEVQSGSYLGEDDIERFQDIYGRV